MKKCVFPATPLCAALQVPDVMAFIASKYRGAIVPAF